MKPIRTRVALLLVLLATTSPSAPAGMEMTRMPDPSGQHVPLTVFHLPDAYAELAGASLPADRAGEVRVQGLHRGEFHGFPAWLVETPQATAAVSVFGGQLLSFVPKGGRDVLWLSPLAKHPPTPIRGGTPVCWPYFAKMGQARTMPSHGLVRTIPWHLLEARREADGSMMLRLAPPALQGVPLHLAMTLRIGRTLTQTLTTENIGDQAVVFTEALHNYFRVGDVRKVSVSGLDGLIYLDKKDHDRAHRQQGDWRLPPQGASDRIYTHAAGHYVLHEPVLDRNIRITTRGSRSTVVWNAGGQAARDIEDIGAGWRHYLSVETANVVPDAITLQPGQRHRLTQVVEVEPYGAPGRR